jgi:predicted nucleic acid-binding protein
VCVIVDANIAVDTLCGRDPEFQPVLKALLSKRTTLVVGGAVLRKEYDKIPSISGVLISLDQVGRLRREKDSRVHDETLAVKEMKVCRSNDEHIIALARVGEVHPLCTKDDNLAQDFLDSALIEKGNVYNRASHKHLITKRCNCNKPSRKKK